MSRTLVVLAAVVLAGGVSAPPAGAVPGQCVSTPYGGFCDEPVQRDGTYLHTEQSGWGWWYSSNAYRVCLRTGEIFPATMNPDQNTPC